VWFNDRERASREPGDEGSAMNSRSGKFKRSMTILVKDLELFAALQLAHFIVWRELHRTEREEATRRKYFREGTSEV
jgi:hypothetical protein